MEEIKLSFLSEDNIILIKEIITEHLICKYNISNENINSINLNNRLRGIMNTLINKLDPKSINHFTDLPSKIVYINKQVIKISINGFYNLIKKQEILKTNSSSVEDDKYNFNKRLEKLNQERRSDNIDIQSNNYLTNSSITNINLDIENVNNKPYINSSDIKEIPDKNYQINLPESENTELVKNIIDFEEKTNEFKNIDDEFEKRILQLKKQREESFKKNLNNITNNNLKEKNIIHLPSNPLYENTNNNKIRLPSEILSNNKGQDYNDLINNFKKDIDINKNINKTDNISSLIIEKSITKLPKPNLSIKNIDTKSKLIIINANDRNWSSKWTKDSAGNDILSERSNANRYNFTIKFGSNSSENILTYIEQNFKNIVSIELSDVILSTHDNPSIVGINKDEIYHQETNLKMNQEEEEIKKKCMNNKYIYYNIYTYPYLLIKISEFSGKLLTSNKCDNDGFISRLVIGKNYVNNSFCKNNDIVQGYILMKPLVSINNSSLDFKPTPLPSLDKLTISLIKPNGDLYGSENKWNIDNINIIGIEITDYSLDLYVDPPFHHSMYLCGDSLKINCFEFLICQNDIILIKRDLTYEERCIKNYFDNQDIKYIKKTMYIPYHDQNFINTEKKDCLVEFNNVISLGLPVKIDSKCNFEYEFSDKGKWSVGGCLINVNIQPTYTLNITYQDNNLDKKNLCIDK